MTGLLTNLPYVLLMGVPAGGTGGSGSGGMSTTLITFALVFFIFYFLIIRPQNKKKKDTQAMLKALKKGDRVATIGGIRGTVQDVKEDTVVLKVDNTTKMEFSRSAVSSVLERRSEKSSPKKSQTEESESES